MRRWALFALAFVVLLPLSACDEIVVIPDPDPPPANQAPTVVSTPPRQTVTEGVELTFTVVADDPDGDTLVYELSARPDSTAAVDSQSGVFTWTPPYDYVADSDEDGKETFEVIIFAKDNHPTEPGQAQFNVTVDVLNDRDHDGTADPEDSDRDGDGIDNSVEETLGTDPDKADTDDDGVDDNLDNCPKTANPKEDCDGSAATDDEQCDDDGDGVGNICDVFPLCDKNDPDGDGVDNCDTAGVPNDNCPDVANPKQDCDNNPGTPDVQCDDDDDGIGNECDPCPNDKINDPDQDGLCAFAADGETVTDNCNGDLNGDGEISPDERVEPGDPSHPHNNVPSDCDDDPSTPDEQCDRDHDGVGDVCDVCPDDGTNDIDDDGVCEDVDDCPGVNNPADCLDTDGTTPTQCDVDGDGAGDACDEDIDGDTLDNGADNCPSVANLDQLDTDGDGAGDACDEDDDGDGVADVDSQGDPLDNCPLAANPNQSDLDNDGVGFKCDPSVIIPAEVHANGLAAHTVTGAARAGTVALAFESRDTNCSDATCPGPGVCVVDAADEVYCKRFDSADPDSAWLDIPFGLAADLSPPYVSQQGEVYFATQTTATTFELRKIEGTAATAPFTATVQSLTTFVDAPDGLSLGEVKTAVAGNPGLYRLEDVTAGQPALLKDAAGYATPSMSLGPFEMPCATPGCGTEVVGATARTIGAFPGLDSSLYVPFVSATGKIALWAYTNAGNFAAVMVPHGLGLATVEASDLKFVKEDRATGTPWYCMVRDDASVELFRVDGGQVIHHFRSSFKHCDDVTARQSPSGVWFLFGPAAVAENNRLTYWNPLTDESGDITPSFGVSDDLRVYFAGPEVYIERISPDTQPQPENVSRFYRWNPGGECTSGAFDCVEEIGIGNGTGAGTVEAHASLYYPVVATSDDGWLGVVGVSVGKFVSNPQVIARRFKPGEGFAEAVLKNTSGTTTGSQVNVMKAWVSRQGDVWTLFAASPNTILSVFPKVGLPPDPGGTGLATTAAGPDGAMVSFHPAGTLVSVRTNTFNGALKYAAKSAAGIRLEDFATPVVLGGSAHKLFLASGLADGAPDHWVSFEKPLDNGTPDFAIAEFVPGEPPSLVVAVEGLRAPPTAAVMGTNLEPWFTYETDAGFALATITGGAFQTYADGLERLDRIEQRLDSRGSLWGVLARKDSGGALAVCKLPTLPPQPHDVGCTQASPAGHDVLWGPWVSPDGVAYMVTKTGGGGADPEVLLWRNLEAPQPLAELP